MAKHNKLSFTKLALLSAQESLKKMNVENECLFWGTKTPEYLNKDWHYTKLFKRKYGKA